MASDETIKKFLYGYLVDPTSYMSECDAPRKGGAWSCENNSLCGQRIGYIAHCRINAKNKFGGYNGAGYVFHAE